MNKQGLAGRFKMLDSDRRHLKDRCDLLTSELEELKKELNFWDQNYNRLSLNDVMRAVVNHLGIGFEFQDTLRAVKKSTGKVKVSLDKAAGK